MAALASVTMMVLKLHIMASRAVDSQHTPVTVPVTTTVSMPRWRRTSARLEATWLLRSFSGRDDELALLLAVCTPRAATANGREATPLGRVCPVRISLRTVRRRLPGVCRARAGLIQLVQP